MTLSIEQEKQILAFWNRTPDNPPGLKELTKEIFGGEFDGRSEQGRAIKAALSKFNLRAKATSDPTSKTAEIQLNDDQKLFVANSVTTMNSLEIARTLFSNPALTNLNAETRAVNDFIKTLDTRVVFNPDGNADIPSGDYTPPKTLDKVLKTVNKYVNFILDKDNMNAQQKKGLEMLINYLHTYRFIRQMNSYDSDDDRNSCEDAFIRYTYDKPDLTQEEIDQYIELANQVVRSFKIQRRSEGMQRILEDLTNSAADPKVSMSWVEAIGKAGTEYDQCLKRCNDLLDDLKEKRSSRLSKKIKENASILNLVQDWRDEERRVKMLKLGELEQQAIANEVEKLTTMSEIKARILGLSKDQILYG